MNTLELTSGNRQFTRLLCAHGETDGIELLPQLFAREVFPDEDTGLELHPFGLHLFQAPVDDPFLHLEVGDAIAEQSADAIGFLKYCHAMTRTRELLRGGQTSRS